jgi:acetyl esterase/lipase
MSSLAYLRYLLRPPANHRYGPHSSQTCDLHLPPRPGPHPVAVLVHGGSWSNGYGKIVMRALAADLAHRGYAAWNIEYRRLRGGGGGWPATFEDVGAAIDHLAELEAPLDLTDVTVIGHSAGGQLALWAATRQRLPAGAPGADPRVLAKRAVGMAAVCDLTYSAEVWKGNLVPSLMGGTPDEVPERYDLGDPARRVPFGLPVLLVHGLADRTVTVKQSRGLVTAATAAGDEDITLVELEGIAHREHIDPRARPWQVVADWLAQPARVPAG